MTIKFYKLSVEAEGDVSALYDYTLENFGSEQTLAYLHGLEQCITTIVSNPNIGKDRSEIREGLRSFLYEKHIVFYRSHDDYIRVVRILNSHRDLPNLL
jgi:toxin ParE1/3/4